MAVTTSPIAQTAGVYNLATGKYTGTGSGTVTVAGLGFTPRKVELINVTTGDIWKWIAGMGTTALLVNHTGPALTPTASAITTDYAEASVSGEGVYAPGSSGAGDGTLIDTSITVESDVNPLTFQVVFAAAAMNGSSDAFAYAIEG